MPLYPRKNTSYLCTALVPLISDAGILPETAVRRLRSLLDGEGGPWRTVAELLELDVTTVQRQESPTVYILRCVKVSRRVTAGAPPGSGNGGGASWC